MSKMTIPEIRSYADCLRLWETCRFPDRGKPLQTSGWRLKRDHLNTFTIERYGGAIATITPTNKITFLNAMPEVVMERVVPFFTRRVARGVYRIDHATNVPRGKYGWPDEVHMSKVAPELFPGVTFNLGTAECENRRPDMKERVDAEINRHWRKAQQEYRKGLLARARMGVFDQYINEFSSGSAYWKAPYTTTAWQEMVADAIKRQDFDLVIIKEMSRQMVRTYTHVRKNSSTTDMVDRWFQSFLDRNRLALKSKFGVYRALDQ